MKFMCSMKLAGHPSSESKTKRPYLGRRLGEVNKTDEHAL